MHTLFSEHSAIMLNIHWFYQRKKSGPGFWKFNASLLEDKEYVKKMCENILTVIEKYRDVSDLGLKWDVIMSRWKSKALQCSTPKEKLDQKRTKKNSY